jgi:hypothetical protein
MDVSRDSASSEQLQIHRDRYDFGVENYGMFVAMDTTTGGIAWKKRLPE